MIKVISVITAQTFRWEGLTIEVRFQPVWEENPKYAHLELTSISPPGAPIPVSRTGYRSQLILSGKLDDPGEQVAFSRQWLNIYASFPEWEERKREFGLAP